MSSIEQSWAGTPARKKLLVAGAVIFTVGIVLRTGGLFTDFWLDEIWGLNIASRIKSPLEIFTAIHFDTNHWLYTFLLWAMGDQSSWIIYRIPSLLAGVATAFLLPLVWPEQTFCRRIMTLVLGALSFPLIFYSSEARGYAALLLFCVLGFYFLGKAFPGRRDGSLPLFWLCCTLGFLSHLTFVFAWTALIVWSGLVSWKNAGWRKATYDLLRLHGVPGVLFLILYAVDIRKMEHGGGDVESLVVILGQLAGWMTGLPSGKWFGWAGILLCCTIAFLEIINLKREQSDSWFFFLVLFLATLGIPIATGLHSGFEYWAPRHFIVCIPFFLLLLGNFIGRGLEKFTDLGAVGLAGGGWKTYLPVTFGMFLLGVYVMGSVARTAGFLKDGRGHYLEAVQFIARESPNGISIGSDHDFRNKMLLLYYARYLPKNVQLTYYDHDQWPLIGPEWLIMYRSENEPPPEPVIRTQSGREFKWIREFPSSETSGWNWELYRNLRNPSDAAPAMQPRSAVPASPD